MLLWFRLGSQTFGLAADVEQATLEAVSGWGAIVQNPLWAPHKVVLQLVNMTGHDGVTSLRLVSTLFAALAAGLFYLVARQWHSTRVALLASWLFISSAWFLHSGRLGTPEILWLVGILALVTVLTPSRSGQSSHSVLSLRLAALVLTFYVPGMVWLVLAGSFVQRKKLLETWRKTSSGGSRLFSLFVGVILISPLVYGLARTPALVRDWLGFNPEYGSLHHVAANLVSVPRNLFLNGIFDPVHWLRGLPLLSSFEIAAFAIGFYFYARNFRAARSRLIAVLALIGWAVVAISGPVAISLLLPVVYLLIASGIAYLLHIWFKVFPNNPVARGVAIGMIILAVALTSIYQTRSYFVAWRYNSETSAAFRNQL